MINYFAGLVVLLLSGLISYIIPKESKIKFVSGFAGISALLCAIPAFQVLIYGNNLEKHFYFNPIFGEVNFIIDPLSAFFTVIISIMCLLGIIYSNGYLKPYIEKGKNINPHITFLILLICAMQLVVTCNNAFMFLIFWEIMSLSSFFLVIFENEKKEVLKAGIKYLVFMHVSVLFIILAFAICSIQSNSYDFSNFANILSHNSHIANTVFILAFFGFGTKAGLVPFHNWLPDAHPAAPSHISAIMSGVMIKTGIYGILRILVLIGTPSKIISYMVLFIAVISGLYGILYAITQHDIKKLLAYSSIENIAIIMIGIGIGMLGLSFNNNLVAFLGFTGGILHILNHSIFKELLFLAAGSVYLKTHTRDIELLGGLIKVMPKTALLFITGGVAICGLPPFNGFISEFLIYYGIIKSILINNFYLIIFSIAGLASLALIGTMSMLCFSKASSIIFLGNPRSEHSKCVSQDVEKNMIFPMSMLGIFALTIGLFPHIIVKLLSSTVMLIVKTPIEYPTMIFGIMQKISIISGAFLLIISIVSFVKIKYQNKRTTEFETWGCGYNKASAKIQYTSSSYAKPFVVVLRPLFKKVFDVVKPKKLFPKEAHYASHIDDIEEAYFINPLVKFDEYVLSKFEKLQDGNLQTYIQYGIGFLVLILIGCFIA